MEQNRETIIELKKEKMMLPCWTAFSYLISLRANATMRKSIPSKKKISKV